MSVNQVPMQASIFWPRQEAKLFYPLTLKKEEHSKSHSNTSLETDEGTEACKIALYPMNTAFYFK